MQLNKIPATVVTGFLGSGKTTLLANILKQVLNKRIAVIVNEFGELDIDANLLRRCPLDCEGSEFSATEENGIYELANGCICCTVEEEFLPVMRQLIERRNDIDHILIETSGLALPKPLVQAFNWPEIKQHCTVDAVITVIDGPAVAHGRFAHDVDKVQAQRLADEGLDHDPSLQELLDDQLSAADLVVVSKNDLLDNNQRAEVEAIIDAKVAGAVKTIHSENGNVQPDLIMGVESAAEDKIDAVHTYHDHHHEHDRHHEHAHEYFDSHVISMGEADAERLQQLLKVLISEQNIFRIKGFVALPDKPMRQVLQAVGQRVETYFDRLWSSDEQRNTRLVFIGKNLNQGALQKTLLSAEVEKIV